VVQALGRLLRRAAWWRHGRSWGGEELPHREATGLSVRGNSGFGDPTERLGRNRLLGLGGFAAGGEGLTVFPRAMGWLVIQNFYCAFYPLQNQLRWETRPNGEQRTKRLKGVVDHRSREVFAVAAAGIVPGTRSGASAWQVGFRTGVGPHSGHEAKKKPLEATLQGVFPRFPLIETYYLTAKELMSGIAFGAS